jgi:ribonucleotide reductase beta subunit family protein with ferritin-like domain
LIKKPNIQKPQPAYVFEYPEYATLADQQLDVFWPWKEIDVSKDKQALLTEMSESEKHGVTTALKLFTKYEIIVGNEYWLGRVMRNFPKPEIQRMAAAFGHVELNSHAPFYNEINKELGLATEDFYNSYVEDETLKGRMDFIDKLVSSKDDVLSLAAFSIVEGAVLYSSFAFLKHFQSNGKNKLTNICRGINMSVTDENLHSIGGASLCRDLKRELEYTEEEELEFEHEVYSLCDIVRDHEYRIIDMIFEKGKMDGITDIQMKHFVDSRINTCLQQLGLNRLYDVKYNPIAEWFYKGINNYQFNDFFSGIGREYQRNWDESKFIWRKKT